MIAAIVLLVLAANAAPTVAPDATGVAYDQVVTVTRSRPLLQPTQFDAAWTAEIAAMKANPGARTGPDGLPIGQARHVAWLGADERIEDPITGRIVIQRPMDHLTIDIDPVARTYAVFKGDSEVYAVSSGPSPTAPPASAPSVTAVLHTTLDTFPPTPVDGVTYQGYAGRITQTVDDSRCKYAQAFASFVAFYDPNRTEPGEPPPTYAPWLTMAPTRLTPMSGCNVMPASDPLAALPFYPHFLLYMVSTPLFSRSDLSLAQLPTNTIANIMMRGRVRTLTAADAALFEVPAGYAKVASL